MCDVEMWTLVAGDWTLAESPHREVFIPFPVRDESVKVILWAMREAACWH